MRLHRLTATAFGPFSGTVEVDFDALSGAGLFLVHGPTGAGKTSILDAICFALYADVPGARPAGASLRSHHAEPGTAPCVTLEFTAGGRRFRVRRSPEFLRPKKRGTGTTKEPASVVLHERRGGSWVGTDTRHDDVAAVLREVLGMGLEQFSRVVLLPQGEFAAFLRATPEERREVLERLFDVSSYAGVEEWLAAERRRTADDLAERRSRLATALARLGDAVADAPVEVLGEVPEWSALEPHDVARHCPALRQALEAAAASALVTLDGASSAAAAATTRLAAAEQLTADRARGARARQQLAELEAGAALRVAAQSALDAARRAAAVTGELGASRRAADAVARAHQAVTEAWTDCTAHLAPADGGLVHTEGQPPGLDHAEDLLRSLRSHDPVVAEVGRLAESGAQRQARSAELEEEVEAAQSAAEALRERADTARTSLEALQRDLAEAVAAAAGLEATEGRLRQAQTLLRVRLEHAQGERAEAALRERILRAVEVEQDARQELLDLRESRLAGLAGELAEHLEVGAPCPVCGSAEHPSPARRSTEVTAADVDEAEAGWSRVREAREALQREEVALQSASRARTELLGADPADVDSLRAAAELASAQARSARELAAGRAQAQLRWDTAGSMAEELTRRAAAQSEVAASARAALAELARTADEEVARLARLTATHAEQCPCVATADRPGDTPSLHRAAVASAERLVEALRAHGLARATSAEATEGLRAALRAQGFDDAEDAAAATLPDEERQRLESLLAECARTTAQAQAVLADEAVAGALAAPEPDLATFRDASEQARSELLQAKDAETLARRTLRAVERLEADLLRQCEELGPLSERARLVRELADACAGTGGGNTLRMRLTSFVLAARLERVAELANERLAVMAAGRYLLQHSDDLARRGARSGLGLAVLDQWTGQVRDTATLSGGEAFLASLALALGLADAVREEAGGFDLQTLFIDEGFGTLDEEALEQVLGVLDGLREGGRAVGVVSHVAELRCRIPSQLRVLKAEDGSTVRVVTGEPSAA